MYARDATDTAAEAASGSAPQNETEPRREGRGSVKHARWARSSRADAPVRYTNRPSSVTSALANNVLQKSRYVVLASDATLEYSWYAV